MGVQGGKLSRKKLQLIAELLRRPTVREAAEATKIGESTAFRWFKDEDFKKRYNEAKRQVVELSISHLQNASGEAVEVLRTIMRDSSNPAGARVSAAKIILELSLKGVETQDILARLDVVEDYLSEGNRR